MCTFKEALWKLLDEHNMWTSFWSNLMYWEEDVFQREDNCTEDDEKE